jgi:hypothetical protein
VTKALQAPPPQTPQTNDQERSSSAMLKAFVTMVIEMIPGGFGPWGIGDVVTAIEAIAGRTVDGLRLTMNERMIYLGASAIPLVPARPILAVYRWMTSPKR